MKKRLMSMALAIFLLGLIQLQAQKKAEQLPYSWTNLPTVTEPVFKADTFNIVSFGAVADGLTLNTASINNAIIKCSEQGGGVVLVPAGLWLTGPVEMKSNVNLHIQRDGTLLFTPDFDQYALVEGVYEGRSAARNQSPIYGKDLENIAITGKGVIDGNGDAWRMVGRDKLTEREWKRKVATGGFVSADQKVWYPSAKTKLAAEQKRTATMLPGQSLKDFEDIKDFLRPNLVVFNNCKRVLLKGVTFQNSPAWCLHPVLCEDLTVRNISVKNLDYAQNGDGLDVESCRNVLVEGSSFDVGDDGICIKSGKDEEGRKRGKPSENIIIRNNIVYKGHGGFVIGSEMSGGARNIFVYDCTFMGTDIGLRFKTARGRGGVVENIFVKNIRMKDIVHDAILFDMYYFTKPPANNQKVEVPAVTEATPQFQNFHISDVVCIGAERGILVRGLPEMSIKNIVLENITLKTNKGVELVEAEGIKLSNVKLLTNGNTPVVYVENGRSIELNAIGHGAKPELFMSVNGERSGNIKVSETDVSKNGGGLQFNHGADATMVTVQ